MANLKTLKPFGKGHDPRRNTKGRPKGKVSSLDQVLEEALKAKVFAYGVEMANEEAIMMRLISDARKGKFYAYKLFMKYRHGNPINFCPNCNYIANKRIRKQIEEAELREIERLEKIKIAHAEAEVDKWIEGWFSKDSKKKCK